MLVCIMHLCITRTRSPSARSRSTTRSSTASPSSRLCVADLRSGQDVVVLAPRRYGKSSLVLRAMQEARPPRRARGLLRPAAHADEGAVRGGAGEDDRRRPRLAGRSGRRARRGAVSRPARPARDRDRPGRRRAPVLVSGEPRRRGHRRHDRAAPRAARASSPPSAASGSRSCSTSSRRSSSSTRRSRTGCARCSRRNPRWGTSTSEASGTCCSGSSTTATSRSGAARARWSSAGSPPSALAGVPARPVRSDRARRSTTTPLATAPRDHGRPSLRDAGARVLHVVAGAARPRRPSRRCRGRAARRPPRRAQQPRTSLGCRHPQRAPRAARAEHRAREPLLRGDAGDASGSRRRPSSSAPSRR